MGYFFGENTRLQKTKMMKIVRTTFEIGKSENGKMFLSYTEEKENGHRNSTPIMVRDADHIIEFMTRVVKYVEKT
jgi:hypothetical protein